MDEKESDRLRRKRSESKSKLKHRELSPSPPRLDSRRTIEPDFDQSAVWAAEEKLTLEERRERYFHPDFVTLEDIPTWAHYAETRPILDRTKYKEKVIKMLLKYNIVKPEQVSVLPRRSSVSSHKTNILTSHPSRHHSQSSEKVEIKETSPKPKESTEHSASTTQQEERTSEEKKEHILTNPKTMESSNSPQKVISPLSSSPQTGEIKLIIKESGLDEEMRFKDDENELEDLDWEPDEDLNSKISLWRGDITKLEIDAIVNAAHESLLGGGGVDGAIHNAAGEGLRKECQIFNGCDVGDTKITRGHNLPAKYVLHTVGPKVWNNFEKLPKGKLKSCYRTCFELISKYNIRTVAFCCISTGLFNYPNKPAAFTAIKMIRQWLKDPENQKKIDRIIFCVDNEKDLAIYEKLLQLFFPLKLHPQIAQLPCYEKERWSILRKALKKPLNNVNDLIEFIKTYGTKPNADLSGLEKLLKRLEESERRSFFEKTLPGIMKLASNLFKICIDEQKTLASVKEEAVDLTDSQKEKEYSEPGSIPLLIENLDRSVSLTQDKIASLLACGFLCLLSQQKFHSQQFGTLNFFSLWEGHHLEDKDKESILSVQTTKLKCIIHYFNRVLEKERDDVVQFRRKVFTILANPPWQKLDFPPDEFTSSAVSDVAVYNNVHLIAKQPNEDVVILLETPSLFGSEWFAPRDFLTPHEVVVFTHPEVMVASFITSRLLKNEALEIRGAETFCECSVDKNGRNFKFVKNVVDHSKIESRQRKKCFVFADPLRESDRRLQLKRYNIAREFNRLYAALQFDARDKHYIVVSGDWGCDPLNGGDPYLKSLLLLLVISSINHNVKRLNFFATTGSMSPPSSPTSSLTKLSPEKLKSKKTEKYQRVEHLSLLLSGSLVASKLLQLNNVLRKEEVSINEILSKLTTECQTTSTEDLLSRLKARFKHWKKEVKQFQKTQEKLEKRRIRAQSWAGSGLRSRTTITPKPEYSSSKTEYSSPPPRALSVSMSPPKDEPKRFRTMSHSIMQQPLPSPSETQRPQSLLIVPSEKTRHHSKGGTESPPTTQSSLPRSKSLSPPIGRTISITAEVKQSQEFDLNSIFSPRRTRSQRLIVLDPSPPQQSTAQSTSQKSDQNTQTISPENTTVQKERIVNDKQTTQQESEIERQSTTVSTPPTQHFSEVTHSTKSALTLKSPTQKSSKKIEHKRSSHEKKQKIKNKDQ